VCRASWLKEYKIHSLKGLSGKYQCYVYQCDVCHTWWRETDRWIILNSREHSSKAEHMKTQQPIPGFDEFGCEVCRGSWLLKKWIDSRKGVSTVGQCNVFQCDVCATWWRDTDRWIKAIDAATAAYLLESNSLHSPDELERMYEADGGDV
jgi:hypothetical protein